MNNLFSNVLFSIVVAAVLGGLIGWFLRRIIALKRQSNQEKEVLARLKGRDRYITQLKVELSDAEEGIDLQRSALQQALEEHTLQTRENSGLTDEYLVRTRAAESKLLSLQRNYIVYKAQKQRELEQLQNNLQNALPLRQEQQGIIHELGSDDREVDMDSTLELDTEMRGEQNPFILRNALVSEKRKVEHLSLVKKELGETYFRFAEEKQRWKQEKNSYIYRLSVLETAESKLVEQKSIAKELLKNFNCLNREHQRLKEKNG
jgi:hypothetical protein